MAPASGGRSCLGCAKVDETPTVEKQYQLDRDLLKLVFDDTMGTRNKKVASQALAVLIQNLNHVKLIR